MSLHIGASVVQSVEDVRSDTRSLPVAEWSSTKHLGTNHITPTIQEEEYATDDTITKDTGSQPMAASKSKHTTNISSTNLKNRPLHAKVPSVTRLSSISSNIGQPTHHTARIGNQNNQNRRNGSHSSTSLKNLSSTHSSSSSLRKNSTLTFEKVKVIPKQRRTSEQSVLSSLSLRSLMQNPSSSIANKPQLDNPDIGLQLPFTDDKRLDMESLKTNSVSTNGFRPSTAPMTRPLVLEDSKLKENALENSEKSDNISTSKSMHSDVVHTDSDDAVDSSPLNLTTQALRKLSMLRNGPPPVEISESNASADSGSVSPNSVNTVKAVVKTESENEIKQVSSFLGDITESVSTLKPQKEIESHSVRPTQHQQEPQPINNNENNIQSQNQPPASQANDDRSMRTKYNPSTYIPNVATNNHVAMTPNSMTSKKFGNINTRQQPQQQRQQQQLLRSRQSVESIHRPSLYSQQPSTMSLPKRHIKQINNPKKPLYVPAVLRNVSETNITNDDINVHINSDVPHHPHDYSNFQNTYSTQNIDLDTLLMENSTINNSHTTRSSIHSTASSLYDTYKHKVQQLFNPTEHGTINVIQPTREHWIADSQRDKCLKCSKPFTIWERKHHCRHCGEIFCGDHVRHTLYLDADAKFCHSRQFGGVLVRVCDFCMNEYEGMVRDIRLKKKQRQEQTTALEDVPIKGKKDAKNQERRESFVGSMPVDWNWSSF